MHTLVTGKKNPYEKGLEDLPDNERKKEIQKRKKVSRLAKNDKLSRLEKGEEEQRKNKLNEPFRAFKEFEGPVERKKTTDKWWTAGICVCFLYLIIHSLIAYIGGKSYRLYSGLDFRSDPCGLSHLKKTKYLYFPLANVNVNVTMCVDKCPSDTGRRLCLYHPDGATKHVGDAFCYTSIQTQADGRYCIPREIKTKKTVDDWVFSWENVFRRFLGDIALTADILILGYLVEVLLLIITLFLLSFTCTLSCCVWTGIVVAVNALNIMALFCYLEYLKTIKRRCYSGKDENGCGGKRSSLFFTLTIAFLVTGLTYLLVVLYLCRKIQFVLNAMKASIFVFKRLRQNKMNICFGRME